MRVGDRERLPRVRRLVKGHGLGNVDEVGQEGMKCEHDQNHDRAEIAQSEARF